ncbi:MAG: nuclear transport factor 2 family protein [Myxococcota bacterium]|nr:nuclear transport factor 2 family protein [Myxococcota bacterium]
MSADPGIAIPNLIGRYAELLDAGELGAVARLFEAAEYGLAGGDAVQGSAAVEKLLRGQVRLHEDGSPRTRHLTTNLILEVAEAGDEAHARSSFTVLQHGPERPLAPIVMGRYEDGFDREDGHWRFRSRRIHIDWVGDVSDHLARGI